MVFAIRDTLNTVLNKKKGNKSIIIQILQIDRAILLGNMRSAVPVFPSHHVAYPISIMNDNLSIICLCRWSKTCTAQNGP